MKEKSLAKNSAFYLIYNILNIIFPFITGVYVARIFLPDTIGQVNAAQNLVQYFVILAFLGLPTYGLREISKIRHDKNNLSKLCSELLLINTISTLIFSLLYFGIIILVPQYRGNIFLYSVVGISVVLNFFNVSWLYEGLEEFGFIAIRNLIFKILCFLLLIVFVKDDNDYLIYAGITVLGTAGNYLLDILTSRKFVKFSFKNLDLRRHLKSVMYLVVVNLAIEIYTLVDVTMLNIFSSNEHIAYYSYGSKIYKILLQVVNTFTMVLVPRISLMYKEKRYKEFNELLSKTLKIIVLIAVPMVIGIQFVSPFLICKIYGDIYINSAYVLNILSVCLVISPIGYLLGSRILLVTGNENKMIIAVGSGAIINVICNLFFIRVFNEYGAAIASVISELVVCIVYICLGKKYFHLSNILKEIIKIMISCLFMLIALILIKIILNNVILECIFEIVISIIVYGLLLVLFKVDIVYDYSQKLINKIRGVL